MSENNRQRNSRRAALIVGATAAVAALALGWREPATLAAAYRFAAFACLAPCVGSLIFILIHRLTGGQWAEHLMPFLARGVMLLPWVWLLTLPLLWIEPSSFQAPPDATGILRAYFSHTAVVSRSIGYEVMFLLYAFATRRVLRDSARADRGGALAVPRGSIGGQPTAERAAVPFVPWFGPAGLIVLTFMLHLLSVDWLVALEPGWYSTGFGFVWMTGQAIAGLAIAVVAAVLAGADPAALGSARRARGLDWGNLLLTAVLAWTYVAFVQFLIIWSGDLPREIGWYLRRGHGAWRILILVLAIIQFGVPVALLLSRAAKQRARWLGAIAALVLVGQVAYTAWLILPAFSPAKDSGRVVEFALTLGAFALFVNRYLTAVRWCGEVAKEAT